MSTDRAIEINVIIILIFPPSFCQDSIEALPFHFLFSYFLQGSLSSLNLL